MKKLNIPERYPTYYFAADSPEIIDIDKANFISIKARGSFTENIFYERISVLKQFTQIIIDTFKGTDQAFELSVLEGLYWNDEKYGEYPISRVFDIGPLSELNYRLMVRVPDYVTTEHINAAMVSLDNAQKTIYSAIELFNYLEGRCIQMLHNGPFIYEYETLGKLEAFALNNNLNKRGVHHEIYLVDFTNGGSQEHLRTILREPIA
jgi:hypothetical protein